MADEVLLGNDKEIPSEVSEQGDDETLCVFGATGLAGKKASTFSNGALKRQTSNTPIFMACNVVF